MFSRRKKKKFKKLLQTLKDDWVFKVDLMLGDFKELQTKVKIIEEWKESHISWDANSWTKFNKRIEVLENKNESMASKIRLV